jgi:hypothetical protein
MLPEFGMKPVAHAHTLFLQTPEVMELRQKSSSSQRVPIPERVESDTDIDIFVNCNWVNTRRQ